MCPRFSSEAENPAGERGRSTSRQRPPQNLELEVTESVFLDGSDQTPGHSEQSARSRGSIALRRFRHRLFVAQLSAAFPFHKLKIDKSLRRSRRKGHRHLHHPRTWRWPVPLGMKTTAGASDRLARSTPYANSADTMQVTSLCGPPSHGAALFERPAWQRKKQNDLSHARHGPIRPQSACTSGEAASGWP